MQTIGLRAIGYAVGLAVSLLLLNPWGTSSVAQPNLKVTEFEEPIPLSGGGWLPGAAFIIPKVTVFNLGTAPAAQKPAVPPKPALTQIETKFYLLGGTTAAPIKKNLSGVQLVPLPLPPGEGVQSTNLTLGVFSDTLPGVYDLQVCADGGGDINEGIVGESDNCVIAVNPITILQGPDLIIIAASVAEANAGQGQQITVKDTVKNIGGLDAGPTTTRYYLVSWCPTPPAEPGCVSGVRSEPMKLPSPPNTVTVTKGQPVDEPPQKVTIPSTTAPGKYNLLACADGQKKEAELNENNNCFQASDIVTVKAMPDLVVTSVAVAAVTVNPSTKLTPLQNSFDVTVTVTNQGSAPTLAKSLLKYSLLDLAAPPTEKNLKLPSSSAAILTVPKDLPPLNPPPPPPGTPPPPPSTVTLTQTVTLYSDTMRSPDPLRASYKVQVCADSGKDVPESIENNNCTSTSAAVVTVVGDDPVPPPPVCDCDLVVTAVPNPPAATAPIKHPGDPVVTRLPGHALPGDILRLGATVQNLGPSDARKSTVSFFLVACPTTGLCLDKSGKVKNLKVPDGGGLIIEPLAAPAGGQPGESDTPPPADFIVYDDTFTGVYFLRACADSSKANPEKNEANNCLNSVKNPATGELNTITIDKTPNLAVVAPLTGQPSSATPGAKFTVKTTVANTGEAPVEVPSHVKYYLVSDLDDSRKDLQGSWTIPASPSSPFPIDGEVSDTLTQLTIQLTTAKGKYHLQGCADAGKEVTESDEEDNCLLAGAITVLGLPDLVVTVATIQSNQKTVARGGTFTIKASVANVGDTDVPGTPAPSLKYFLADPTTNAQVFDLNQPQTFATPGGLRHGSNTSITKILTVPVGAPVGTFNVRVCADSADIVSEGSEGNNCLNSSFSITVN